MRGNELAEFLGDASTCTTEASAAENTAADASAGGGGGLGPVNGCVRFVSWVLLKSSGRGKVRTFHTPVNLVKGSNVEDGSLTPDDDYPPHLLLDIGRGLVGNLGGFCHELWKVRLSDGADMLDQSDIQV